LFRNIVLIVVPKLRQEVVMAADLVRFQSDDLVTRITMDDGKVNVFSPDVLAALHEAFDRAEGEGTAIVLTGRPGCFSAGFDLKVLQRGTPDDVRALLLLGATLAERILSFPAPVVVACSGHAFPAGAFLLLAADHRIGARGPFKLGLNEVRIGLTLPWFATVLARSRLSLAHADHAAVTGTMFDPDGAVVAGLLDAVVPPEDLEAAAWGAAADLARLDRQAHSATKLRMRQDVVRDLRGAIESELTPAGWAATA
jgi:enoyl-CoA hydratase